MLSALTVFAECGRRHNIQKGGIFVRYFKVDVRKEPTEYGFMPTMQMYLLEESVKKRPIVLIVPGGGYTMLCMEADGEKTAMQQYSVTVWSSIIFRSSRET